MLGVSQGGVHDNRCPFAPVDPPSPTIVPTCPERSFVRIRGENAYLIHMFTLEECQAYFNHMSCRKETFLGT